MQTKESTLENCQDSDKESDGSPQQINPEFQEARNINSPGAATPPGQEAAPPCQEAQPSPGYETIQGYAMPGQPMGPQPQQGPPPAYQPPPAYAAQGNPTPMPEQQDRSEGDHSCNCHGNAGASNLKYDQNRYGQLLDAVTGIMNGEPDIHKIAGLLDSYDVSFWKGAIIGVVSSFVLTNDTVKGAITGTISKAMGKTKEPV